MGLYRWIKELKNKMEVHKSGTYVKIQLFTKRVGLDLISISLNTYFRHDIAEKFMSWS